MSRGKGESAPVGTAGLARHRRSEHSHAAIVDATVELLREGGYSRLTIQAVAARARVGKATICRWWPSKTALVAEAIETHLEWTQNAFEKYRIGLTMIGRCLPGIRGLIAYPAGIAGMRLSTFLIFTAPASVI